MRAREPGARKRALQGLSRLRRVCQPRLTKHFFNVYSRTVTFLQLIKATSLTLHGSAAAFFMPVFYTEKEILEVCR
jgi:hypothetical protein